MKQINLFEKFLGSGFFTGYIPFASGTFGSLAASIIYFLIPGTDNIIVLSAMILVFFFYGIYVSYKFENVYGKDPAECTIDEVVGTWIALLNLPKSFLLVVISFFIWRALDIIKPFPARRSESLPGGWGIMVDDVISAFYTFIIMQIMFHYFKIS
ncbi:phosphatidylglycerophosphatase A [Ignavibacterium album]|uniref:phosphatidylglycerophosphatase A family protein n=1 Tax=Ignavibacterium album TaxID=591197 RepID=UPI0026F2AAB8|nr:phosphatidylglycerophosphatase A [Ignavibacterium album]